VLQAQNRLAPPVLPPPRLFDRQGWSTLLAGALLLVISFTTNYGDDNLLHLASLKTAHQIGMGLHFAALAALVGDVELASRLRLSWSGFSGQSPSLTSEVGYRP
jgi:hypothetical protein